MRLDTELHNLQTSQNLTAVRIQQTRVHDTIAGRSKSLLKQSTRWVFRQQTGQVRLPIYHVMANTIQLLIHKMCFDQHNCPFTAMQKCNKAAYWVCICVFQQHFEHFVVKLITTIGNVVPITLSTYAHSKFHVCGCPSCIISIRIRLCGRSLLDQTCPVCSWKTHLQPSHIYDNNLLMTTEPRRRLIESWCTTLQSRQHTTKDARKRRGYGQKQFYNLCVHAYHIAPQCSAYAIK